MWSAERDEDRIHLRDVHMYLTVKIQNADPFYLQHIYSTLVLRKDLFGKCPPGHLGNHSVLKQMKLASNVETPQLLTTSKIHFHFRIKENKYLTLGRDQGIQFDAGNLTTGMEGRPIGSRFRVFWLLFSLLFSLKLKIAALR